MQTSPHCLICSTPLEGTWSLPFRVVGIHRSPRNRNVCNRCNTHITEGRVVELTVLFADLSSFTELTQELGPERVHEVVDAFLKMATDSIVSHGGFIDKYIGDAVMACFNVPIRHRDHGARAVAAAREIQERLPEHGARLEMELRASVGIASGWARVGRLGSSDAKDQTAIGDVVNVASRLQGQAAPGQIVIDEPVYMQAAKDLPELVPEALNLKGFLNLITAYRLGAISPGKTVAAGTSDSTKMLRFGTVLFALLGAPCGIAVLIGPLAVALGIGSAFAATSSFWIADTPWIRWPIIGLALAGAAANVYTLWHARQLRKQHDFIEAMTRLERRRSITVVAAAALTLSIAVFEIYAHGAVMQHSWP